MPMTSARGDAGIEQLPLCVFELSLDARPGGERARLLDGRHLLRRNRLASRREHLILELQRHGGDLDDVLRGTKRPVGLDGRERPGRRLVIEREARRLDVQPRRALRRGGADPPVAEQRHAEVDAGVEPHLVGRLLAAKVCLARFAAEVGGAKRRVDERTDGHPRAEQLVEPHRRQRVDEDFVERNGAQVAQAGFDVQEIGLDRRHLLLEVVRRLGQEVVADGQQPGPLRRIRGRQNQLIERGRRRRDRRIDGRDRIDGQRAGRGVPQLIDERLQPPRFVAEHGIFIQEALQVVAPLLLGLLRALAQLLVPVGVLRVRAERVIERAAELLGHAFSELQVRLAPLEVGVVLERELDRFVERQPAGGKLHHRRALLRVVLTAGPGHVDDRGMVSKRATRRDPNGS